MSPQSVRRWVICCSIFSARCGCWLYFPFVHFNAWLTETLGQGDPTALQGFVNHIEATDPEVYNHLFDGSLPDSHPVVATGGQDADECINRSVDIPYGV